MTIELLLARKIELQKQQAQLVANANAISGAIQDIDYWLSELQKQSAPAAPSSSASGS